MLTGEEKVTVEFPACEVKELQNNTSWRSEKTLMRNMLMNEDGGHTRF